MKKLINFRPILFLALFFTVGIAAAYFVLLKKYLFLFILLGFCILSVSWLFVYSVKNGKVKRCIAVVLVCALLFISGLFVFNQKINAFESADVDESHYYSVTGLIEQKSYTESGCYLILSDLEIKGVSVKNCDFKISVFVSDWVDADIGNVISFRSILEKRSLIYDGRFSAQNIAAGIKYYTSLEVSDISVTDYSPNLLMRVRIFINSSLKKGLSKECYSVANAMLLGDSSEINTETLYSYRSAGVAHIFAVSGLHIGFVATALGFLLKRLKANRVLRFIIITIACFFYSGICGFSASSIRASIMCAVLQLSAVSGDRYDGLSSVSLAMFIVLLFNPVQLFCVGFQLSFGVVYGLLIFSKPISKIFSFLPQKISSSLGAVIAAQLTAIPISLRAFGSFSIIAVAFNLVFIPVSGVIFIVLLCSAIIGGLFGIEKVSLFISEYVLRMVNGIINGVDYKIFIVGGFTLGIFSLFYYGTVLVPSGIFNIRTVTKRILAVFCAVVCVLGTVLINVNEYNTVKVYVVGSATVSASLVSYKDTNVLVVNSANYTIYPSALKRLSNVANVKELDAVILLTTEKELSLQLFTTKLSNAFNTDSIMYYGEKLVDDEILMAKSFPNIDCIDLSYESVTVKEVTLNYLEEGRISKLAVKDKSIFAFGSLSESVAISLLSIDSDMIIAYNRVQELYNRVKTERFVSCREHYYFKNGESEGVLTVKL